jgi:DnaK suppressor protein
MDTTTARKRLEEIQAELERSIAVLRGEAEQDERVADYPQDPADAGANLSESERTQAVLFVARTQHSQVIDALRRRPARGQAGGRPLRIVPGEMGPAPEVRPRPE